MSKFDPVRTKCVVQARSWRLRFPAWLATMALVCAPLMATTQVEAKAQQQLGYTKLQGYYAALRYLRVDQGYAVIEKDADSGYLLFEYPRRDAGVTQGSIEVIERTDSIVLIVQLPQMPTYHERVLIDGLLKKLHGDYGDPPEKRRPEKPSGPHQPPREQPPKGESPPDGKGRGTEGRTEAPAA